MLAALVYCPQVPYTILSKYPRNVSTGFAAECWFKCSGTSLVCVWQGAIHKTQFVIEYEQTKLSTGHCQMESTFGLPWHLLLTCNAICLHSIVFGGLSPFSEIYIRAWNGRNTLPHGGCAPRIDVEVHVSTLERAFFCSIEYIQ